jgi:phosphatidylserine/phosphatidylglycerophosphate/cardiolipin synthase-like enzyme
MKRFVRSLLVFLIATSAVIAEEKEPIVNYEVLFSPQDHVADELISLINKEKKSIKAAVFCLMHQGIAKALIEAHKRGVEVEIIVDPFSVKTRSPVKKMAAANIPIYVWDPSCPIKTKDGIRQKKRKPLMHDKFCILGNKRVWTGSFNFTFEGATRNRENVIVLENESIAGLYLAEFERLKEAGCVFYSEFTSGK